MEQEGAATSGAIAQATPSSEEEFHSPDEREDSWVFQKDIGVGGFGIVKLFLNEVRELGGVGRAGQCPCLLLGGRVMLD